MKKNRRTFLKNIGQLTLVTGLTAWWMSCGEEELMKIENGKPHLIVAKIFRDNMVLQRDQPIPIWGWSNQTGKVIINFNQKEFTVRINSKTGFWKLDLPKMPAGGPFEIKIKQDIHEIIISNILIGDVFLCSGQSNMEWPMSSTDNVKKDIQNSTDTRIRQFKIPRSFSVVPAEDLKGGEWTICNPESVPSYSAIGFYFAKNLRQHHDIPIGIINSTKGGSNIKMWMHSKLLNINNLEEIVNDKIQEQIDLLSNEFGPINTTQKEITDSIFSYPKIDDKLWIKEKLPMQWGKKNYMKMLGKNWFRKSFYLDEIPAQDSSFSISLGQIDDADVTYVNGVKVGATQQIYEPARVYEVKDSILKKGENVIAIQIENLGDFGGVHGDVNDLFYKMDGKKYSLAGDWKVKPDWVKINEDWLFEQGNIPSVLYNAMIAPLANFSFKAILWYQGESDTIQDSKILYDYRFLFEKLIPSWRQLFSKPNLPFIFAQISTANGHCQNPQDSVWARLRESQSYVLNLPNTAQIVTIDTGINDVTLHPQNKPIVGKRFSLAVRKLVYGEAIFTEGPTFKKMERDGKYLNLYFSNIVKGLLLKFGDEVNNIAIAGADKQFLWAQSRVDADKVVIWNDEIEIPVAVRYAWCDNPFDVNLINSEGLPAAPFRTDDWE